jgi:hypothetical protein
MPETPPPFFFSLKEFKFPATPTTSGNQSSWLPIKTGSAEKRCVMITLFYF